MEELKKRGRPTGWRKTENTGRKTIFASTTISARPEEIAELKKLAAASGKSVSRFIIDSILN